MKAEDLKALLDLVRENQKQEGNHSQEENGDEFNPYGWPLVLFLFLLMFGHDGGKVEYWRGKCEAYESMLGIGHVEYEEPEAGRCEKQPEES